jgi:hypothetical protein
VHTAGEPKAKHPLLEAVKGNAAGKTNEEAKLSTQQLASSIQCDGGNCEHVLR